ncbi:MAG TPA: HD domain-containing protein [Gammaproteobacteria bacterium]|jgi:hypothetical protein
MTPALAIEHDEYEAQERRSDYDVTNAVRVTSVQPVCNAVWQLFASQYPAGSFDPVWMAFHDFERMYTGKDPDYHAVDTSYHDIQHTLDVTLALARLIVGHERSVGEHDRLGEDIARFALIAALFHDAGYLRHRRRDVGAVNGAVFTRSHVGRSGAYLEQYLPRIGLGSFAAVAARVVHFTGYEMPIDDIELDDPRHRVAGQLLGTADLLAQMADRCYLEKCRDRLYPEFVLGEVAVNSEASGSKSLYRSGRDLLQKTMSFYQRSAQARLETGLGHAYRFMESFFDGRQNLYLYFVEKNMSFLEQIRQHGDWSILRRRPQCVVPDPHGEARLMLLALRKLREISDAERDNSRRLRTLDPNQAPPGRP